MKATLFALFVALLMVGCGEDSKKPTEDSPESNESSAETPPGKSPEVAKVVVDWDQLELREGGWCFEGKPFTGVAVGKYPNGQKNSEATFKEGEQHGLETTWYSNGQKEYEAIFEDGKKDGLKTVWRENGQKQEEATYKDGKLLTAVGWKPNGEKCPDTNLVNGNGIVCYYHKNGQKATERTYKDGKLHGLFTRWYENGQKEGELTVKDGGVISEKRWDEDGNLLK